MKVRLIIFVFLILGNLLIAENAKKILLISSYNPMFPTFYQQIAGIKSEISNENIKLDVEYMDSKRFYTEEDTEHFKEYLKYKMQKLGEYNLIMTADDSAFDFAEKNYYELFFGKAIVFLGVNNIKKAEKMNQNPNITGVVERVSIKETLEMIKKIQPNVENIIAISDTTISGKSDLQTYTEVSKKLRSINYYSFSTESINFKELKGRLRLLNEDNVILLLSLYRDKDGNKFDEFQDGLNFIKSNSKVPIYHLWEHGLGDGVLGGKIISHFEQGKCAAKIAKRILNGEKASKILVVEESPNVYYFDNNELTKYKINKKLLPKNSQIINRKYNLWIKHKLLILTVLFIIFSQLAVIILLVKKIIKERKKEKKQLEDCKTLMEKCKGKSNFLVDISHELRTPINGIMGMLEVLKYTNLSEKQTKYH